MGTLVMIGQLMLALAILITLHELGHFAAARMFGIRVEKFYLFFDAWGVKLFSFKYGDTEYGIGWLPLGGYVKIAGMVDESLDTSQMASEPQPWEFRSKPAWQRLIVMIGGVTVNLILGVLIYSLSLFSWGEKYFKYDTVNQAHGIAASALAESMGFRDGDQIISVNGKPLDEFDGLRNPDVFLNDHSTVAIKRNGQDSTIHLPADFADQVTSKRDEEFIGIRHTFAVRQVAKGSPATKAGLEDGDSILTVNDTAIQFYDQFKALIMGSKGKVLKLRVQRGDSTVQVAPTVSEDGTIGFYYTMGDLENRHSTREFGFFQSFAAGTDRSFGTLANNAAGMWRIVTGKIKAKNALSGPVAIASRYGKVWDWQNFWLLTAVISLVLAFMNLLPIPALDGGHVVFLLIEMITGKPVSQKVLYVAQVIGMVLIMALMVFVFWNDIARLLSK